MSCRACPDPAHRVGLCVDCLHAIGATLAGMPALIGMPRNKLSDLDAKRREELERANVMLAIYARRRLPLEARLRAVEEKIACAREREDALRVVLRKARERLDALNRRADAKAEELAQANETVHTIVETIRRHPGQHALWLEVVALMREIDYETKMEGAQRWKIMDLEESTSISARVVPQGVDPTLLSAIDTRITFLERVIVLFDSVSQALTEDMTTGDKARTRELMRRMEMLIKELDMAKEQDSKLRGDTLSFIRGFSNFETDDLAMQLNALREADVSLGGSSTLSTLQNETNYADIAIEKAIMRIYRLNSERARVISLTYNPSSSSVTTATTAAACPTT